MTKWENGIILQIGKELVESEFLKNEKKYELVNEKSLN